MNERIKKKVTFGLCKGRHEMPVEDYIFPSEIDPTDIEGINKRVHDVLDPAVGVGNDTRVVLYVSGLTVATVAVINWCAINVIPLTLMHYNVKDDAYYPQRVASDWHYANLREGGYLA